MVNRNRGAEHKIAGDPAGTQEIQYSANLGLLAGRSFSASSSAARLRAPNAERPLRKEKLLEGAGRSAMSEPVFRPGRPLEGAGRV